jgi:O-antigen/teichoic acid export membrane protein
MNINCEKTDPLKSKFLSGFSWNLAGSIAFEVLKIINNGVLISYLSSKTYGAVGSIFSIIYFASRLTDSGTTLSVPPFFGYMVTAKENFKNILIRWFLLPLLPTGFVIALITMYMYYLKFSFGETLPLFLIPVLLVPMEAVRSVCRQFLHTAFKNKQTIFFELCIFVGYLIVLWGGVFIFKFPLTLNVIFIPYVLDSLFALFVFFGQMWKIYKKLPSRVGHMDKGIPKRIISTRCFNFLIKISRELFTTNFMTPLFAIKYGLKSAGLFYFASALATSMQAVVKAAVGYSGSALLAGLKEESLNKKKEAFDMLCQKLMMIIIPIAIFLLINYQKIVQLGTSQSTTKVTASLSLLYLVLSFSEFFFSVYEQFYIIEEAARSLFFFKLFELTLLWGVLVGGQQFSLFAMFLGIIFVRMISFIIVAVNAYFYWGIRPSFKTSFAYIVGWGIFSVVVLGFLLILG